MTANITTKTVPVASSPIERLLEAVCEGRGADTARLFAEDALLEAVVPNWRFEVGGSTAIASELGRWYGHPGQFESVNVIPTPSGAVVTFTLLWEECGVPHACRQAHLLDLDANGRISRDQAWCGGRWPADLLAEMEAARHAV